jgi:hypothetical protein
MATAMLNETLDNFQHSTRLIPESRSCTLISSHKIEGQVLLVFISHRLFGGSVVEVQCYL